MKPHLLVNPPWDDPGTSLLFHRAARSAQWRYRRSNIYPATDGHLWYDGVGYWAALDFDDPGAVGVSLAADGTVAPGSPAGVAWYCIPVGRTAHRTPPPYPPQGPVAGARARPEWVRRVNPARKRRPCDPSMIPSA